MIVLIDPDERFHERFTERLERPSDLRTATTIDDGRAIVDAEPGRVDVVFLGPGLKMDRVIEMAEGLRDTTPEISVVVITSTLTADLLQRVLRAGVRDVLPAAFSPRQLAASLEHAASTAARERQRFGGAVAGRARGTVVTVLGAKGGVGKSVIASNVAVLLATATEPVALVDLDVEFGGLGVYLQLQPRHTIADAAQYREALDDQALQGYLTRHRSGVHLLAAPQDPGLGETVTAQDIRAIVDLLARRYRTVIIDTPASFNDLVLAAIDASDVLATVTAMDVPSIRSAGMCLRTLEMLGVPADKVRLILNRADSRVGLTVAEVEKGLGMRVAATVPSSREVPLSVNRGEPIALADPRSAVTRALAAVATLVRGESVPDAAAPAARTRAFGRGR